MKARLDQKIMCAAFCVFLVLMSCLFFLLPKEDFSELEKRYLAETPEFSWSNLTSGELGEDIETYMADHVPGRNFFVGLNAYADLLTGRQVTKGVYLAAGDRLVQSPVLWNEAQAKQNTAAISAFAQSIDVPVDFMVIPSAGWAARDSIIGLSDSYMDESLIELLYAYCGSNIRTIDIAQIFSEWGDPASLYYRTDHHWTTEGAYLAYQTYMQALGREYATRDTFQIQTVSGFQGSTYSESALWMVPGEDLELWHGSSALTVTNGESKEIHEGVFYEERLDEADKYTVYLDGNHSIVRIENPEKTGKLLVIRDSYSNCLGTLLAESYGTVVLVDLRYYKNPVSALLQEEAFDNVLVCYSMENIMTDTNLVWLK